MVTVCIVGRPNVGKSTLFNRLLGRRVAITAPTAGVTRDAVHETVTRDGRTFALVDTGGLGESPDELAREVFERSRRTLMRADVVVFVTDVTELGPEDRELAALVRRADRPTLLAVNKVDSEARVAALAEHWSLGFEHLVAVSAAHGRGIDELWERLAALLSDVAVPRDHSGSDRAVTLAIVGRPNSGKSSLLNRLIGDDRALVSDLAGTTRDTVRARFSRRGVAYEVVDTAGLRRTRRVRDAVEFYSVTRAIEAIERSELALLLIDATRGMEDQDKKIATEIADRGRGVVVGLNKWDLMQGPANQLEAVIDRIRFLFPVFSHVPVLPLSAHTGEGIDRMLTMLAAVRGELYRRVDTGPLNQALERWVARTPPPSGKKPYKVRYMTQVGTNPVRFIAFVNRPRGFPEFYRRFLINQLRATFGFHHVPLLLEIRGC